MAEVCQEILEKFRRYPALLRAPDETIQIRHLRLVLQRINGGVFTDRTVDALCAQFVDASETLDGATSIPLEPFVRSIFAARPVGDDVEAFVRKISDEDVEAVRVRKLTGELILSLSTRRIQGMDVRGLKLEVTRELQGRAFDMKLIANGRALSDPSELVQTLVPQGQALEVVAVFQDLPVLDEDIGHLDQLETLKRMILCDVYKKQMEGLVNFRRLLSIERNPPIEEILTAGILPRLVEFSRDMEQPQLQFEAMWALTNIASGTSAQTQAVVDHGAVPVFISMISCRTATEDVREQAVWALGNIAGDSPPLRNLVIEAGAVMPVAELLANATKTSMVRNAMWTISNLCRGKPKPQLEQVTGALPAVARALQFEDPEVLTDACWALSYLSDGDDQCIRAVLDAGVIGRVVALLHHESESIVKPAVRVVGNICSGENGLTQRALDAGALPALLLLLSHHSAGIRKEACWSVSNVVAGTQEQIRQVIEEGLLPAVIRLAMEEDVKVRFEALWVLSNIFTEGSPESVEHAVREGCVGPLIACFSRGIDRELARGIRGISGILRAGEQRRIELGENPYAVEIVHAYGREWADGVTAEDHDLPVHLEFIAARLSEVPDAAGGESPAAARLSEVPDAAGGEAPAADSNFN